MAEQPTPTRQPEWPPVPPPPPDVYTGHIFLGGAESEEAAFAAFGRDIFDGLTKYRRHGFVVRAAGFQSEKDYAADVMCHRVHVRLVMTEQPVMADPDLVQVFGLGAR